MNVDLNEKRVLESLTQEYISATEVSKKTGLNWFVAFGTLCFLALQGRIETIKTSKNYLFKKSEVNLI